MKYLQLERSAAILSHRLAHLHSDCLLHIYGSRLSSFFTHPEPDRAPNIARVGESRPASATGRPQTENSPVATASARSLLLGDSLATMEELVLFHNPDEEIGATSSENGLFIPKTEFSVRTGLVQRTLCLTKREDGESRDYASGFNLLPKYFYHFPNILLSRGNL